MTSSLKSKFDFGKRRALFVSAHKVAVFHWHKGDISTSYLFDANAEGRQFFERYLSETPNIPMYMLVDLFEEEFKRETAPHVYGADRASIIERKKSRLFRDTPYYNAKAQGREPEGRKDDLLLLSAITNPKLISSWAELLEKYQIPLVGIYSIPLLTESLAATLPDLAENNLIVSIQSISGLRQTFIQDKQLRVSRLVQLPRYGTEPYSPIVREEVDKIRRYLNSLRLIPITQDNSLNIYFILAGDMLVELKNEYREYTGAKLHFLDINDLLARSGSSRDVSSPFSDQLYIYHLLKTKPANSYAMPSERRFNSMRNMRISMWVCSVLMLITSLGWSGYTLLGGLEYRQNTLSAKSKTGFYTARYEIARESLPQTPVEAADLKVAVELAQNLSGYKATPVELIQLISDQLSRYPGIKPGNIHWINSTDPNIKIGNSPSTTNQGVIGFSSVSGTPDTNYKYYQIGVMENSIFPFDGNYRQGISLINEFAETLRKQPDVIDISILTLPLDISSASSLTGNTESTHADALFSLRITLGIKNED